MVTTLIIVGVAAGMLLLALGTMNESVATVVAAIVTLMACLVGTCFM